MLTLHRQVLKGAAALLGGLAWLGAATTAIADPFAFYMTPRIFWASDSPFVPYDVSGDSDVFSDARFLSHTGFFNVDPAASDWITSFDTNPSPLWINPGETIFWSLSGQLSSGDYSYPICAVADFAISDEQCGAIRIATLMSEDFGEFSLSGPVFAFDGAGQDPVQIGWWEIHSFQHAIPEPATLGLLALGLLGLGFTRRKQ